MSCLARPDSIGKEHDNEQKIRGAGAAGSLGGPGRLRSSGRGQSQVNEYDLNYSKRLREFLGIELIIIRSGELLEAMGQAEEPAMEKLADTWIREATGMKNVTRSDVVRSTRLYFGFKALLKKYSAAAITYESATLTSIRACSTGGTGGPSALTTTSN